jgi:hypothetical protein
MPTAHTVDPAHLITQLRQHIARLRTVPATCHASPAKFEYKDLHNYTHVFLRKDAACRALEPPYSGPYQVLSRKEKTLQVLIRGKLVTVPADEVKPAYMTSRQRGAPQRQDNKIQTELISGRKSHSGLNT